MTTDAVDRFLTRWVPAYGAHGVKIRFLINGALNTLVGLATFPFLYFVLDSFKLHYLGILVLSQTFCIAFAYVTNKVFVFRTSGNYVQEILRFSGFHLGYFVLNLGVLPVLVEVLGMRPVVAQFLFACAVIVTSYFWQSRVTFIASKKTARGL